MSNNLQKANPELQTSNHCCPVKTNISLAFIVSIGLPLYFFDFTVVQAPMVKKERALSHVFFVPEISEEKFSPEIVKSFLSPYMSLNAILPIL